MVTLLRRGRGTHPLDATIEQIIVELSAGREWSAPLKESPAAQALLSSTPDEQMAALLTAITFESRRGHERKYARSGGSGSSACCSTTARGATTPGASATSSTGSSARWRGG